MKSRLLAAALVVSSLALWGLWAAAKRSSAVASVDSFTLETRGDRLVSSPSEPPPSRPSEPPPKRPSEPPPSRPSEPPPNRTQRATLPGELAFIPADVDALVRVDLTQLISQGEAPGAGLKALDFVLRAQQPVVWELLHSAGITIGKELAIVYLVVGAHQAGGEEPYLVCALGRFDAVRLGAALRRTHALVEPGPAPLGRSAAIFLWHRPSGAAVGATEQPPAILGSAAVGIADDLVLFGAPALVRRALATRAALGPDVRTSTLTEELRAVDTAATLWGVARGPLGSLAPGLRRGRFSAALAAPGMAPGGVDGLLALRAEFTSPEEATAFGAKVQALFATVAILGEHSPLGQGFAKLRQGAVVNVVDSVLSISGTL